MRIVGAPGVAIRAMCLMRKWVRPICKGLRWFDHSMGSGRDEFQIPLERSGVAIKSLTTDRKY